MIPVNPDGTDEFLATNHSCILIGTLPVIQTIESKGVLQTMAVSGFNVAKTGMEDGRLEPVELGAIIKSAPQSD